MSRIDNKEEKTKSRSTAIQLTLMYNCRYNIDRNSYSKNLLKRNTAVIREKGTLTLTSF